MFDILKELIIFKYKMILFTDGQLSKLVYTDSVSRS